MMNQILQAFRSWDERQQKIDQIGPTKSDQTAVNRLKLAHLRECRHKLSVSVSVDEKPFMPLLDNVINRLEKEIYPNLISRLFSRLKDRLIDRPAYLQYREQQRAENIAGIRRQLDEAGLGSFSGELEKQLQTDLPISLTCQLDHQRSLTVDLHFTKDAQDNYQLKRMDAAIGNSRYQFKINEWPGLDMVRIKNLLEGRAIKQDYIDVSGKANSRWLELSAEGNVKQYLKEYGYHPEKLLEEMPVGNKQAILKELEKGNLVMLRNGFLSADPGNAVINYFDRNKQPVSAEHFKAPEREQAVVKHLVKPESAEKKTVKRSIAR